MKITVIAAPAAKKGYRKDKGESFLIRTDNHNFLYGFSSGKAALKNLQSLGVSSDIVDAGFLPCGERAESGGLKPFLYVNFRAVVYARLNAFAPRFKKARFSLREVTPDKALYKNRRIHRCKNYFLAADNSFVTFSLTDGDRNAAVPAENGRYFLKNEAGELLPDDFSQEMYLLVKEGKKWTLFCGAAHSGLVNILRCAGRITEKNLGGALSAVVTVLPSGKNTAGDDAYFDGVAEYLQMNPISVYAVAQEKNPALLRLKKTLGDRITGIVAGDTVEPVYDKK